MYSPVSIKDAIQILLSGSKVEEALQGLLESDARVDGAIRKFKATPTAANLKRMLEILRAHHKALHATGNWSPPSSTLTFIDTDGVIRRQYSYNPNFRSNVTSPNEFIQRVVDSLMYRPTTQGLNSRMSSAEADAQVATNLRTLPYKELVAIDMPTHLLRHYPTQ